MPVQVTMQPLQPSGAHQQQAPVPLRWTEAIAALEEAQGTLDELGKQIEGAIYLDEETWTQAVPHAQFTAALHVSRCRCRCPQQDLLRAKCPGHCCQM